MKIRRRYVSPFADLFAGKFFTRNVRQTMSTFTTHKTPHVTHMPTLTGGIGADELETFYSELFTTPPSLRLTLLSRTIGADRVVDEVHVRFKHTHEVPWILPGVKPTNKRVEILVVSIVALKGGKLHHEHVYWDQASVLLQTGLLDPKLAPEGARKFGVERLPVVGREAAQRVLGQDWDEEGEADNDLIYGPADEAESTNDDKDLTLNQKSSTTTDKPSVGNRPSSRETKGTGKAE